MKALSDYVHGKGLKLGIYSDAGYAQLSKEKPQSHKKTRLGKCGWQKQKFKLLEKGRRGGTNRIVPMSRWSSEAV
jgi:hypothetical protein